MSLYIEAMWNSGSSSDKKDAVQTRPKRKDVVVRKNSSIKELLAAVLNNGASTNSGGLGGTK